MKNKLILLLLLASSLFGQNLSTLVFDADYRTGSLLERYGSTATNTNATFTQTDKGFGLQFNGTSSEIYYANNSNINFGTSNFSIEWWGMFRKTDAIQYLLSKEQNSSNRYRIYYNSGTLWILGETTATANLLSATVTFTPSLNKFYHIVISVTRATSIVVYINGVLQTVTVNYNSANTITNTGNLYLCARTTGTSPAKMTVLKTRLYSSALSASDINKLYQEFNTSSYSPRSIYPTPTADDILTNKDIYLYESFDYGASNIAGRIPNWIAGTGSYKISEATSDDAVVKSIKKGAKYLQCTSAGTIALPSTASYATSWEFDVYKGADGNSMAVNFLSSEINYATSNGNELLITSIEDLRLRKRILGAGNSILQTVPSYVVNGVWYHVTISRNPADGQFYIYIQGGIYTTKTLVSVSGGSGTNPVTDNTYKTSKFFVLDLDAGDRFANLKITNANYLTKGYYDYLDRSSMVLSGSNVMMWGDKSSGGNAGMLGTDLLSGWNFTSGWAVNDANISATSSNTFVKGSGAVGSIYNSSQIMTSGKTYKLIVEGTITSGSLTIADGVGGGTTLGTVSGSFSSTYYFVSSATPTLKGRIQFAPASSTTTVITKLILQEANPSGNNLAQGTSANMPLLESDGILFDGTSDYLKTAAFTLNQPTSVYFVGKQVTWTDYDRFWDGNTNARNFVNQRNATPSLGFYGGTSYATGYYSRLVLNTFGILRAIFNGTSSNIKLNNGDILNTSTGANSFDGFTLGAQADGGANQSNIKVKGIALIQGVLDPMRDEILRSGLKYKYGAVY